MDTKAFIGFIRELFPGKETITLHEPTFGEDEKHYLNACLESTYVSTVGSFVDEFEQRLIEITGASYCIATNTGTSALHASLEVAGVSEGDEVLTQPLTFVATANAIRYCGASPVFLDVDEDNLGLSPEKLKAFLAAETESINGCCFNRSTSRQIKACVVVHTFGHPARVDELAVICRENHIELIEDAAEALGSTYHGTQVGTTGSMGVFSFNGNKLVTTGGGGAIVTNDEEKATRLRHLTTTARTPHRWDYIHDEVGFNYRLPNLNAAIGCPQLARLDAKVEAKRTLAQAYIDYAVENRIQVVAEPASSRSNYWLNAVLCEDPAERDGFLLATNNEAILCRPSWRLLNELPPYRECQTDGVSMSKWLADRLVNLPSSPGI